MASNSDFVQYVADQCSGAGEIGVRKMFGDWVLYCNGLTVGLICDNCLYVKQTGAGKKLLREEILRPPYPGAKPCFYIGDIDDRDYVSAVVRATFKELSNEIIKIPK